MAKTKTCKFCKKKNDADKLINVNMSFFCNFKCATQHGMKLSIASKKRSEAKKDSDTKKKNAKQKKEFKLNDVKHQHSLTQKAFNKMRVLEEMKWFQDRGLQPECISCGHVNMDWCCGHFKTRGSQGNLRYDRMNTFLQCNKRCNMMLSGNIAGNKTTRGYVKGLAARFGQDESSKIIDHCESNTQVKKWTGEELSKMREDFNKNIRKLQ